MLFFLCPAIVHPSQRQLLQQLHPFIRRSYIIDQHGLEAGLDFPLQRLQQLQQQLNVIILIFSVAIHPGLNPSEGHAILENIGKESTDFGNFRKNKLGAKIKKPDYINLFEHFLSNFALLGPPNFR